MSEQDKQTIAEVLKNKMQPIKDATINCHLNYLINSSAGLLKRYKNGEIEKDECVERYIKEEDATRAKLPEATEEYLKEAREKFHEAMKLVEDSKK